MKRRNFVSVCALAVLCTSCAVGPDYKRPQLATAATYKEDSIWSQAVPNDAAQKGDWWSVFNDPVLDGLEKRIDVSNQNVAAYAAAFAQARALVREQRAALLPTVTANANATRSKSSTGGVSSAISTGSTTTFAPSGASNVYQVTGGASWDIDLWGKLRRSVENARASAAASAADLANARLSAQGALASDYWQLRESDAEIDLVGKTVAAYQRNVEITQNRYTSRIAAKTDLLQAQSQLFTTQATLAGLTEQRQQLEHAIAVLVGETPETFSLAATPWDMTVPVVPTAVPSQLLQRRPDVAAAERRVAAANAEIGVNKAAYFPSLSLSANDGFTSTELSQLFAAASNFWSVGASAALTLFDAGARSAAVAASRAAYDQAVANYRQTALSALQDVENDLVALQILEQQYGLRQQASMAADESEERSLNQYRAGLISYTDVVTVQATAFSDRTALVQTARDRQTTTVALIQALGGGWDAQSPH